MRLKLDRSFYRPKGATVYHVRDPVAEIHIYTLAGAPYACIFGAKRSKPDSHYRFKTAEKRAEFVKKYLADRKAGDAMTQKYRADRAGGHTLKVGDILYSSWGYDQTNIDFYEVVEVPSRCFVVIVEVGDAPAFGASQGGPQEKVMPSSTRKGEPMRRKADKYNSVRIRHNSASLWDGRALSQTGWGWGH